MIIVSMDWGWLGLILYLGRGEGWNLEIGVFFRLSFLFFYVGFEFVGYRVVAGLGRRW